MALCSEGRRLPDAASCPANGSGSVEPLSAVRGSSGRPHRLYRLPLAIQPLARVIICDDPLLDHLTIRPKQHIWWKATRSGGPTALTCPRTIPIVIVDHTPGFGYESLRIHNIWKCYESDESY